MGMIIRQYLWLIFLGIAIFLVIKSIKQNKLINKKDSVKLRGTIISHQCNLSNNGMLFYSPIYEYEYNGEKYQHVSENNQIKPLPIGTQIVLYYNQSENKVVETTAQIANMALGVVFAGLSIVWQIIFQ